MRTFNATTDLTGSVTAVSSFFISETAGAAAVVNFRDGGASGAIFQQCRFAAVVGGSTQTVSYSRQVQYPKGLYIEVVSGTVIGAVQSG